MPAPDREHRPPRARMTGSERRHQLINVARSLFASTVELERRPEPVRAALLRLTQLFNMTGHPAISIPCGATGAGLPCGCQLVGPHGETGRLLDLAEALEPQITPESPSRDR